MCPSSQIEYHTKNSPIYLGYAEGRAHGEESYMAAVLDTFIPIVTLAEDKLQPSLLRALTSGLGEQK